MKYNMKKIFLTLFAMTSMMSYAEFLVGVQPTTLPAGISVDDCYDAYEAADSKNALTVILCNEETHPVYNLFQFNIYVPSAMKFDADGFFFAGDRMPARGVKPRLTMTIKKLGTQSIAGYTGYQIVAQKKDEYPLVGESGQSLLKLLFSTEGLANGIYPIYTSVAKFAEDSFTGDVNNNFVTSYIRVGSATSTGSLVVKEQLPSFVNEFLKNDAGITNLDLSAATAVYGDFTYVDSRNVVGTEATASVKYEGNKTGYYSVNVPFGGAVTGNVYKLTSTTAEYAHFDPVTEVEAGKTYLATGEVAIAANAKVASVAEQTNQTGNYVLDNTFYHGKNLTVPATRGLFEGASLSNLRVVVDGVLTNINVAQIEAGESAYDLQGRQTNNAKNGVFVVNGKKQFVK